MQQPHLQLAPYAKAAIQLLKGPVFEDQKNTWEELNRYEVEIRKYFEKIALELVIDKRDGYAYLKQIPVGELGQSIGLVRKMPLTYELSLVCVLLRDWLQEFESGDLDAVHLYISPRQFRDRLEMFFKEKTNELKFIKELNRYFKKCVEMGFLKAVNQEAKDPDEHIYEVRKIIKARVKAEELIKFKQQLQDELTQQ